MEVNIFQIKTSINFVLWFSYSVKCYTIEIMIILKIILFASSLVGAVIWMSYRASITSNLSVREHKIPFTSLAELADVDNYRFPIHNSVCF